MDRRRIAHIATLLLVSLWTLSAHAQDRAEGDAVAGACYPAPTEAHRQAANQLAAEAYELHKELRYDETAAVYERALALVRHPHLYLQAGIAFFNALRLLEAYEHLQEAVRCGHGGLHPEKIEEAERKLRVLRARLGQLSVACDTPGAEVRLNDELWFTCPTGSAEDRVLTRMVVAGQYVVTVTKEEHVPVLKPVTVSPRQRVQVTPVVMSEDDATSQIRRWPAWQPWAVAGAGLALGAVGGGLRWHAGNRLADSEDALVRECFGSDTGCASSAAQEILVTQEQAATQSSVGIGLLAVGTAALAGGLVWAVFNRPSTRRNPDAGTAEIEVVPTVSPQTGALSLRVQF